MRIILLLAAGLFFTQFAEGQGCTNTNQNFGDETILKACNHASIAGANKFINALKHYSKH